MAAVSKTRGILIVDDDLCAREALAQWFRGVGWMVNTVERCAQALCVAGAGAPDHLIVEQRLCDGSGPDLFLRLRALNPELSGVVVTRYPSIAGAVQAIRMGFRDYLAKPIDWRRMSDLFEMKVVGASDLPANDAGEASPSLARVEWEHIHSVLLECRGNISAAARVLGLHRRSLQRKLRRVSPPSLARRA
jgi:two-component system response regulator RegA